MSASRGQRHRVRRHLDGTEPYTQLNLPMMCTCVGPEVGPALELTPDLATTLTVPERRPALSVNVSGFLPAMSLSQSRLSGFPVPAKICTLMSVPLPRLFV